MTSNPKKILLSLLILIFSFTVIGCDLFGTTGTHATLTVSKTTTTTTPTTTTTTSPTTTGSTTPSTTTTPIITTTTTTTAAEIVSLEVTPPVRLEYALNDILDLSGMVVTFILDGNETILDDTQYAVSAVDMTTDGEKTITISYLDLTAHFTIAVGEVFQITMLYYLSASGLTGEALETALRAIVNTGFTGQTYGAARDILQISDADPSHSGNILLVYTRASVSRTWDAGATWSREHVWPQSYLGAKDDNDIVNICSDLQNLKPINQSVNSSRGNKYYDTVTGSSTFFPGEADKGDIARILLYMVIKYDYLDLVEGSPSLYHMAKLSVLLQWNAADPVDDFERNRNEVIYDYQHNRNPFIDYPQLVDMIWPQA
jgi:endonuclease I